MKKILSLILSLILVTTVFTAAVSAEDTDPTATPNPTETSTEESAGIGNPWTDYSSLEELQADYPGFELTEIPKEATDITYSVLEAENYTLFEIRFTLEGISYTYRIRPSAEAFTDVTEFSGLYFTWDKQEEGKQSFAGIEYPFIKQYSSLDRVANVYLYDPEAAISYDLSASNVDYEVFTAVADGMFNKEVQVTMVSGNVLSYEGDELKLLTDNLNTLVFHFTSELALKPGDYINLAYTGAFSTEGEPVVADVELVEASKTFAGSVTKHDKESVTVQSGSGSTIRFMLTDNTALTGADKEIKKNATVTVTYYGDIVEYPTAFEVYTDVVGDELPERLIDKTLSGTVVKLSKKSITIVTEKGRKWTFKRTEDTEYPKGKSKLEVDCTVKITYDGYASSSPDAKKIQVTKAPTPKPVYYEVTGYVENVNGIWVVLDDGNVYTVNGANCEIIGEDMFVPGTKAVIKYYIEGNERIAVRAEFDFRVY